MGHLTEVIPLAVILASLGGSFHCVSMCGGLLLASAPNRASNIAYHFGRLLGYSALGALAGAFGQTAFSDTTRSHLAIGASLFIALLFLFFGFRSFNKTAVHFNFPKPLQKIYAKALGLGGFATGLFSAFLPCGWLHSFVLGAATTGSPVRGALFMATFWLGTVPALSLAPAIIQKVFKPISIRVPKLAATVMIAAGLATLAFRTVPMILSEKAAQRANEECPFHGEKKEISRSTE